MHTVIRPVLLVVGDEPGMIAIIEQFARARGFDGKLQSAPA